MRIAAWSGALVAGVALLAGCGTSPEGGHDGNEFVRPDAPASIDPFPQHPVETATPIETPEATPTPWPAPTPIAGELVLKRTLPHSGWSEGLDVHDGQLWHAYPGSLQQWDPGTGQVRRVFDPPSTYSESLAWRDGELWNVSYHDANVYVGTPSDDGVSFTWRVAGTAPDEALWGITHDAWSVIVSGNGRETLWFLDPETLEIQRELVTPVDDIEDIAFDRGAIWASSYTKYHGQFFRLDPYTGSILDVHALPDAEACSIVDGIAVSESELFVTGKDCPFVYVYDLP